MLFHFVLDIDECLTGADNCDSAHGLCDNTDGSFTCTCEGGYEGDGTYCTGKFKVCTSVVGIEPVSLTPCFVNNLLFHFVLDIDECLTGAYNCDSAHGLCDNTDGSFTCTCEGGYEGDGTSCTLLNILRHKYR